MPATTQPRNSESSLRSALRALMDDAASAPKYHTHAPGGDYSRAVNIPANTTRSKYISLSSENLVGLFDKEGRLRRIPAASASSEIVRMGTAIVANSRVANAGTGVIIMPDPTAPRAVGKTGTIVMETIPGFVRNVEAAQWSTVDINAGAEVPVSAVPIKSAEIDWNSATAKAVCFKVGRRERIRYGDQDRLCDEIIAAITLGLARAADEVMLSALSAASLEQFTVARAAAQGLTVDELRALVGTAGAGAAIGHDGRLRVTAMPALPAEATPDTAALVAATLAGSGMPGELTPDMAGTIVGAFNRVAVAVRDDAVIGLQQTGLAGEMTFTAWASMQAQIPDASKFWTVA